EVEKSRWSMFTDSSSVRAAVAALALYGLAASVHAQTPTPTPTPPRPTDNYDELFQRYLQEARDAKGAAPEIRAWAWMSALTLDHRATNVNDLVTIRVIENITGQGTADAALTKDSSGSVALSKLFGMEKKFPSSTDPSALVAAKTATDFKGAGTTTRAGVLTAQMTARVADVLPNGDMVVEGVREIEINGDHQIVVLSGVVRPVDIDQNNVVLSTEIGQLRIRYFGKGLMKDNLKPGWLVRVLNKVF
ncbi:MAG TPA: flagellar basal body L-ring protein FlgH, partial [Vicinamibacterales bacterium]